jgi:hypothetical protein
MRALRKSLAALVVFVLGCTDAPEAPDNADGATLPVDGSSSGDGSLLVGGSAQGGSGASARGGYADVGGVSGGDTVGSSAAGSTVVGTSSGSTAGAGAAAGSGGTGGAAEMQPPGPIDYRLWSLQLPIGSGNSPTTIEPERLLAGYRDEYFYPADDGGQMFMDPVTGVTTSGSTRCRTEMREAQLGGGQAAWSASAVNRMTVAGKIIEGGSATITIGQILNGTDSFPLVELEWSSSRGGFQLFYEEAKGGGDVIPLNTPWPQNQRYTFTLELSNDELLVSVNGKQVYSRMPGANMLTKKFYFKFGNYDQNTSEGPASTTPHSIVEAYSVDVVHQ